MNGSISVISNSVYVLVISVSSVTKYAMLLLTTIYVLQFRLIQFLNLNYNLERGIVVYVLIQTE